MKNIILKDNLRKGPPRTERDPFELLYRIQQPDLDEDSAACLRDLRKKHSSYKSQDKQHHKFDDQQHITLEQIIEKLIECKLLCYYCQKPVSLVYHQRKDPRQWTLERLNNNLGHYHENTCIACLKCNLGRRTDNHEYYKMGKTMILKKGT